MLYIYYERRFPQSRKTPHIMSVYWDHTKTHEHTSPDLLDALNSLRLPQDMKLYRLVVKAWEKVSIALLQRARNVQTIAEALVYDRTRTSRRLTKRKRKQYTVPDPCGFTLVQTLLTAHRRHTKTATTPTTAPILTTIPRRLLCETDRCRLYESANHRRGVIIGNALYCPVCKIFHHAVKHTYHMKRALRNRHRLIATLSPLTYIPGKYQALTTTHTLLVTLSASTHGIASLIAALRKQHAHLIRPGVLNNDRDPPDSPQSPMTHGLHYLARTLNIPSYQHTIANPQPTQDQQHARYLRASTICPCPTTTIATPGTPRIYEHCNLLRHIITRSHTNTCPACASPHEVTDTTSTCPDCVVYALLYQNTFNQRWTAIQTAANTIRPAQLYPSINSPPPMAGATAKSVYRRHNASIRNNSIAFVSPPAHMLVNLALSKHTLDELTQTLTVNPTNRNCN